MHSGHHTADQRLFALHACQYVPMAQKAGMQCSAEGLPQLHTANAVPGLHRSKAGLQASVLMSCSLEQTQRKSCLMDTEECPAACAVLHATTSVPVHAAGHQCPAQPSLHATALSLNHTCNDYCSLPPVSAHPCNVGPRMCMFWAQRLRGCCDVLTGLAPCPPAMPPHLVQPLPAAPPAPAPPALQRPPGAPAARGAGRWRLGGWHWPRCAPPPLQRPLPRPGGGG